MTHVTIDRGHVIGLVSSQAYCCPWFTLSIDIVSSFCPDCSSTKVAVSVTASSVKQPPASEADIQQRRSTSVLHSRLLRVGITNCIRLLRTLVSQALIDETNSLLLLS
jgi:hypothetical protein